MREINDNLGYRVQATPDYLESYEAEKNLHYTKVKCGDPLDPNNSSDLIVCSPEFKLYKENQQIKNLFAKKGHEFQAPLMVLLQKGFRIEPGDNSVPAHLLGGFNLPLCFEHDGELRYLALNLSYVAVQDGQCYILNTKNQKLMKISDDVCEVLKNALDSINKTFVDSPISLSINKTDNPDASLTTIIFEMEKKVTKILKDSLSKYIKHEKSNNRELQREEAKDHADKISILEELLKRDLQPIIGSADYFAFEKEWSEKGKKSKAVRQLDLAIHVNTLDVKNDFLCDAEAAKKGRVSDYLVRLFEAQTKVAESTIFQNQKAKENLLVKLEELYKKLEKKIQVEVNKGPKADYKKIGAAEKIALEHYKMCMVICDPKEKRETKKSAIATCYENSSKDPLWWSIVKVVGVIAIFAAAAVIGFVVGAAIGNVPGGVLGAIKGLFTAATWGMPVIVGASLGVAAGAAGSSTFGIFAHIGVRKIAKDIEDESQNLIESEKKM